MGEERGQISTRFLACRSHVSPTQPQQKRPQNTPHTPLFERGTVVRLRKKKRQKRPHSSMMAVQLALVLSWGSASYKAVQSSSYLLECPSYTAIQPPSYFRGRMPLVQSRTIVLVLLRMAFVHPYNRARTFEECDGAVSTMDSTPAYTFRPQPTSFDP